MPPKTMLHWLCVWRPGRLSQRASTYQASPSRDVLEIYGTEGTLTFDPFDGEAFTIKQAGSAVPDETFSFPTPSPVHLPFIQALDDVYRGESATPHVTGEEGAKTTRILDAALRFLLQGGD